MTKAEILAALKQLLSKADFTAAMNTFAAWVQGKYKSLKEYVDEKIAEVNASMQTVYRPSGDITPAELVPALLVKANLGKVYNLTADVTTTADWKEGADKKIVAGSDVAIVEVTDGENVSYKFNAMAGMVDLGNYLQPEDFETIGSTEAVSIVNAAIAAAESEE